MKYFAVDAGSTYIKTAFIDIAGQCITIQPSAQTPPPYRGAHGLFYEVDAQALYEIVLGLVDQAIDTYASELNGILISTQMHGVLLVNRDGQPATPYISWQDTRSLLPHPEGGSYLDHIRQLIPDDMMREAGVHIKAGLGMCNAYTLLKENHYDVEPGALLCTIGSYFIYRLTGNACCHITNAAPLGLADVVNCRWDARRIERMGFSDFTFPEIIDERQSAGTHRGIPVYADFGDQQCCVLGGLVRPETDINVNFGTGAQIGRIGRTHRAGIFENRPFFDGYYLRTITQLPAGRNMNIIAAFLQDVAQTISGRSFNEREVWSAIQSSLDRVTDRSLQVQVGFFPATLGHERGCIDGIRDVNFTMANLCGALYDGIAETYRQYYHELVPDRSQVERLIFTGGVPRRDPQVVDHISTRLGLSGVVAPYRAEVFAGLYQIALVIQGEADGFQQARELLERVPLSILSA